jgi:hypothetical protein
MLAAKGMVVIVEVLWKGFGSARKSRKLSLETRRSG